MRNIFKYLVMAMIVAVLAMSASAAVTTFDLVPYDEDNNQWEVTVHINLELDDSVEESHVNTFAAYFFFNPEKLVLCDTNYDVVTDYYEAGETPIYCYPVKSGRNEYSYSVIPSNTNGVSNMWIPQADGMVRGYVTVNTLQEKFDSNNNLMFSVAFKLADGVTTDDLVYSDFVVQQLFAEDTYTGTYGYKYQAATDHQMDCVNNVVPEAPVVADITIPVTEGDVIYFVDGTKAVAEATGDRVVPASVGYIAVNTGKTAQAVYYVDGTTATKVHENAVLGTNEVSLKPHTMIDGKDKNGLRFKLLHNSTTRSGDNAVEEVGFIMTVESQKVLNDIGADYELTMDLVPTYARTGMAYGKNENGALVNKATSTVNETAFEIHGVMWNIPLTKVNVTTNIVSRPYFKVGGQYIYGEVTKATLYDTAKAIKESSSFETLDQAKKDYIIEIIALVDGYTEIVKDEVIIDVGSLYE